MKYLFGFIFIIISLFPNNLDKLRVEHNLILQEKGLYTGRIYKGNMSSNVVLGVITDFSLYINQKEVFTTEVKNNRFHGEGIMIHERLGKLKLQYENAYLKRIQGANFVEEWEHNNFLRGFENGIQYIHISKNPYLEFFDKHSFNVIQNFFDLKNIDNGSVLTNTGLHIFDNRNKVKKYFFRDSLEVSISLVNEDYYFISITNLEEGKLYQGKIVNNKLHWLTYSDVNGIILLEEYRHNLFFRGRNLRNAITYSDSQLIEITNLIRATIKNRLNHLKI